MGAWGQSKNCVMRKLPTIFISRACVTRLRLGCSFDIFFLAIWSISSLLVLPTFCFVADITGVCNVAIAAAITTSQKHLAVQSIE